MDNVTMDRLRKRADFLKTMNGTRFRGPFFLLAVAPNGESVARVGYTVTKKQGNSVQRNRIRRRLKAQMHAQQQLLLPGHDYVVTASADVLNATATGLKAEVLRRLEAAGRKLPANAPTLSATREDNRPNHQT
jgi:ribonuclease P protein component